MNSEQFNRKVEQLIYIQGALLEEILPNLRAVSVEFKECDVKFYCFFDGAYSEDDEEEMSLVATYAFCGRLGDNLDFECIRCDEPNPLPLKGELFAFVRREDVSTFDKNKTNHLIPYLRTHKDDLPFFSPALRALLFLSIQYALLGVVDQNLRWVSLEWTDKKIFVYFFFNQEIRSKDIQMMDGVKGELLQDFPKAEIQIQGILSDRSQRFADKGTDIVFAIKGD